MCSDKAGNILISRVLSGSAADKTGLLRSGDLIHEINDTCIQGLSVDDVADIMVNSSNPSQCNFSNIFSKN